MRRGHTKKKKKKVTIFTGINLTDNMKCNQIGKFLNDLSNSGISYILLCAYTVTSITGISWKIIPTYTENRV